VPSEDFIEKSDEDDDANMSISEEDKVNREAYLMEGIENGESMKANEGDALYAFYQEKYNEAFEALNKLSENTKDESAIEKLQDINHQIIVKNKEINLPQWQERKAVIEVQAFQEKFDVAKRYMADLRKNPDDAIAREKLRNQEKSWIMFNKEKGYPAEWVLSGPPPQTQPPMAAESSKTAEARGKTRTPRRDTQGGVQTKVGVAVRDESNGNTTFGKVETVRRVGRGTRVIVNRGTDENPYYESHPGGMFGNGVAKEWLEKSLYNTEELPRTSIAKGMKILAHITVPRTSKKEQSRKQIQYYYVSSQQRTYISTRSTLIRLRGYSAEKLEEDEKAVDVASEMLLGELDDFRRWGLHPDTGDKLTDQDRQDMPWLGNGEPEDSDEPDVKEEDGEEF